MSEPKRRTLTGLTPRAAADNGLGRLIRANREEMSTPERPSPPFPVPVTSKQTESVSHKLPKYLKLKRREARMYDEQADALTMLARRINAERRGPDGRAIGERITDNTLLRLAIDLLLERADQLRGTTEQELALSLGLNPRTAEAKSEHE